MANGEDHTDWLSALAFLGSILFGLGSISYSNAVSQVRSSSVPSPFSPTGSLAAARDFHTASLLQNGTVLIVGGGPSERVGSYLEN